MEPTDQLDAPNRRLPESRVRRLAKTEIRLSDIFELPRKFFIAFDFPDRASWLALALDALF
jgi:hypothetical protein